MLQSSTNTYSASVNGLNTDGNDLAHVEQSNLRESNYELCRDGTRRRRRAVIEENLRPDHEGVENGSASTGYIWRTPGRQDDLSILAEQRNRMVHLYEIDHENPAYMRANELYSIDLGLFGDMHRFAARDLETPCTYAEGNGVLYIFHIATGPIKIERVTATQFRATPVGTWIRDYEGATEVINADVRPEVMEPLTEYAPGVPFLPLSFAITSELDKGRSYNLSNTGWDAKGVSEFIEQSSQDYEIRDPTKASIDGGNVVIRGRGGQTLFPALTDRYLRGRLLDEHGGESFSFGQLVEARDNKSHPPMGARVRHSALHPAGTLVGLPNDMTDNSSLVGFTGDTAFIRLDFDQRVYHTEGGDIRNLAAFIHYMTYTVVDADGVTHQGGMSGVLEATRAIDTDGHSLVFSYTNRYWAANGYTDFQIESVYAHPSPEYFPHQLPDDASRYDHRQERRPATGAYFAGRLWQGGDQHTRIYYSQQVDVGTSAGLDRGICKESLCYAAADPTDGFENQLIATDGGYINLNDSGTHYGLVPLRGSLYILTDNGIWAVSPGQAGLFLADDFRVDKISDGEVLGYRSWVVVDNELHVATDEGILVISQEGIQSLTDERIRIRYDEIVAEDREALASYDPETYVVRWAFPDRIAQTTVDARLGVTMLSYHRLHNSWFQYDFPDDYTIVDMVVIPYTARSETYNKFRYLVVAKNFDVLTLGEPLSSDWGVEAKLGPSGFDEWVQSHTERFTDFLDSTGDPVNVREPMPAFMLTNHWLLGSSGMFTQIKYLIAHNKNVTTHTITEPDGSQTDNIPGSTLVSARWDWFDEENQNKYSKPHQTYRFRRSYFRDDAEYHRGEPNLVSKVKIRGRGREFRLFWEAEGQNDSHLTGWVLDGLILGVT